MNHERLTEVSSEELDYEISEPKGMFKRTWYWCYHFWYPYGAGKDNTSVIDTISKYYDFAITGFSDLMFLDCGWVEGVIFTCNAAWFRTYYDNGTLTPVNRYLIRESSQDSHNREYQGNYSKIFE